MSVAAPLSSWLLPHRLARDRRSGRSADRHVTFSANLRWSAKLSFSSNALSFPDADPDTVPLIAAARRQSRSPRRRASLAATVTLTVLAADDLRSGVDTIPARR